MRDKYLTVSKEECLKVTENKPEASPFYIETEDEHSHYFTISYGDEYPVYVYPDPKLFLRYFLIVKRVAVGRRDAGKFSLRNPKDADSDARVNIWKDSNSICGVKLASRQSFLGVEVNETGGEIVYYHIKSLKQAAGKKDVLLEFKLERIDSIYDYYMRMK